MFICESCAKPVHTLNSGQICSSCENKEKAKEIKVQDLAEQEIARRLLSKRRLLPFVERFVNNYEAGWVHKDITQRLEKFSQDVADRKSPRLMLFVPPRHGKSEIASIRFPAWHLGHHPTHEIMVCSYSASLSMGFSRKVREMIRDRSYQNVFKNTKLNPDSQSVESWLTTEGGGYMAAGVGGAITGKGAHILLIDDPIKNFEEADSAVTRESIWNWWTTTAYTRLAPGGGVLVIQTRWHQDDLSGRLVTQMEEAIEAGESYYDDWEIIRYPAIADHDEEFRKEGEALHPERYPVEALKRIQASVNPRDWAALYQQTPTLDEGAYFRRDFFKYWISSESGLVGDGEKSGYKVKPELLTTYSTWDLALGKKESNDFTAGLTFGVDVDDNIYLLDLRHGRWDAMEIVEQLIDWYEMWKPAAVGIERTHMQMAIGPFLNKRIRERKAYGMYIHEQLPGRRDKELRARSMQGRLAQGKVYFPKNAPWLSKFELELLQFPAGAHDDMCLTADTHVVLDDGSEKPIIDISTADIVATPNGHRRVLWAGMTNPSAEIWEVVTSDGRTLKGTANHPVFVDDQYVAIDQLRTGDELCVYKNATTEGNGIGGIRRQKAPAFGATSMQKSTGSMWRSIEKYGRTTMDLFQKTISSITSMGIRVATISGIWSALVQKNMAFAIECHPPQMSGWRGIVAETENTAHKPEPIFQSRRLLSSAINAANNTSHTRSTDLDSVRLNAGSGGIRTIGTVIQKIIPQSWRVSSAGTNSKPSGRTKKPALQNVRENSSDNEIVSVISVRKLENREPVFNITVEEQHVFYANGLLTHNCDVFGYAGLLIDELVTPQVPIPAKKKSWKDELYRFVRGGDDVRSAMSA